MDKDIDETINYTRKWQIVVPAQTVERDLSYMYSHERPFIGIGKKEWPLSFSHIFYVDFFISNDLGFNYAIAQWAGGAYR